MEVAHRPETTERTTALPTLIPQPNGGALKSGGTPGNKGGGSTPNAIRRKLRKMIAKRPGFLAEVMDGNPMVKTRIRLTDVLPEVECPNCGESGLTPKEGTDKDLEITVMVSASPKDRIAAYDTAAKYGLGTLKEVSVEQVRERLGQTLETIRAQLPPEQAETIVAALRPIWA